MFDVLSLMLAFGASVMFVFLKVMQSLNSVFKNYIWIVPTSMLIAFAEVYVIANVARTGYYFPLVLCIGIGSGLGALSASVLHRVIFKKSHEKTA
jgi:hypothetical protein